MESAKNWGIKVDSCSRKAQASMKKAPSHVLLLTIALLPAAVFSQTSPPAATLNAVSPPTVTGETNYADFDTYVVPNPVVNGVTVAVPWNQIDKSTSSSQSYQFSTWVDDNLGIFEGSNKVVNIIIMPALEGGVNSYTPKYVFSPQWANGPGTTSNYAGWGNTIPTWSANHEYQPTTYILDSAGHYEQEVNTYTPSSGYDGHCTTGPGRTGGLPPNFSNTGGTITDGTCAWQDIGTQAPLQAQAACPSYPAAPAWNETSNYSNGTIVVPTNQPGGQPYNLHFYTQDSGSRCTSSGTEPTWPTNGGTVTEGSPACKWQDNQGAAPWTASHGYSAGTIIVPESSAYNLHFYKETATSCTSNSSTPPNSSWSTTGGSFTEASGGCTWLDYGTVIPNEQGLPVSYNLPFESAYQQFAAAAYTYFSTASNFNSLTGGPIEIGYIRFGMTQGGESSPLCNSTGTQSSGWPLYTKDTYLAYISDMLADFNSFQAKPPVIPQVADMHAVGDPPDNSYADAEAQLATSNSIGIETNGLQVNDVTSIGSGSCTTPSTSISGDWCYNFYTYCGKPMGKENYPICSLQTLTASTPGIDTAGSTGSLSVDGSFAGLIPTAIAHGATNLEIYPIDTLLAVDPDYCTNDIGAECGTPNYANYQGPYESIFETFLGLTSAGIYNPVTAPPLVTGPSNPVTFYWYPMAGAYPCNLANVTYSLKAGSTPGGIQFFNVTGLSGSTLSYTGTISATSGSVYVQWSYSIANTCNGGSGSSGHVNYVYTAS
jgi:hypothetical protein